MDLNCETILDLYNLKNRKVLCQIKVDPMSQQLKNTSRCLSPEQWMTFDKELEKLLIKKDFLQNEKAIKFNIVPCIQVKVKKSKLSFCKLLGAFGQYNTDNVTDVLERSIVLECLIGYQVEVHLNASNESQEYDPQTDNITDGKACNQLTYEKYTPSKKGIGGNKIGDIKNIECNEDTYFPKPIYGLGEIETLATEAIPKYTPAPINTKLASKKRKQSNLFSADIIEIDKHKTLKTKVCKKSKRGECEYIPKSQEFVIANVPIYIPTPIQETADPNLITTDNFKQNKKRSNTIDVFPDILHVDIDENHIPRFHRLKSNTNIKNVCIAINEADNALIEHKKRCSSTDTLPEILDEHTEENHTFKIDQMNSATRYSLYENKNLRKRSVTVDEVSDVFGQHYKGNIVAHDLNDKFNRAKEKITIPEKKYSRLVKKTGLQKTQTKTSNVKLEENTIEKNGKVSKVTAVTNLQKDIRMEGKKCEITKSCRRPVRSPSNAKMLIEDQYNIATKSNCKKHKISPKNKELFGTDDDDDDEHCFRNNKDNDFGSNTANAAFCKYTKSKKNDVRNLSMKKESKIHR